MPSYLYKCPYCNKTFELTHSMKEAGEPKYHQHNGLMVKMDRVFIPPDIQFKGPGFYKTDNQ